MISQDLIYKFFEDELSNTSEIFLYNDKQLLKDGEYKRFAERQLKKAKKIFLGAGFALLYLPLNALWYLTQSNDSLYWKAGIGLFMFLGYSIIMWKVCKEYYTIRSSMNLMIRILESSEEDEETVRMTEQRMTD